MARAQNAGRNNNTVSSAARDPSAKIIACSISMLRPVFDDAGRWNGFSWLAVLLGYPILGIWYWCADQTHVQRVLAAKDLKSAQNGALFAGFLKITPVFLMVLPGVMCGAIS